MSVRRSAGGVWIEKRKKKDMSLILCIETGTDICSVGLARDGELISLRESDQGRDPAGGDRFPGCPDRSCERGLRSGDSLGRSLGGGVPLPDGGRPPHGGLYPGIRCCGNSSFGRIRRGRYGGEFRGMARRRTSFRDFRKRCGQMCRIAARCDADPGGAFCPRACAAGTGGARCGPHGGYRVLRAFLPEGFRRHPVEKEIILRENIFSGKLISGD